MANIGLMKDVEARYREASGLSSRANYSIFYGPLAQGGLVMMNANPGGTPTNYRVVDTLAGEHEYIEGRESGPTTRNGARLLTALVGRDPERLRRVQVFNRFFRRSAIRPTIAEERRFMGEARPFLEELLTYVQPRAFIFGGDAGVTLMAEAHGGQAKPGRRIMGPNGSNEATYLCEYEFSLPYLPPVQAFSIYHPSKLNGYFDREALPILRRALAPLRLDAE